MNLEPAGILLINKPKGKTSFSLVSALRRIYNVRKIGHAGTLDPFASGVMVLLVGKQFTRLSDRFLNHDKEYIATLHLGIETDTFDCEGKQTSTSNKIPSETEILSVLDCFKGEIEQTPPMFSAKKVQGKKLYELARKGISIERKKERVHVQTRFLSYEYPYLCLHISCSKGTYIRSMADEIGKNLGCGAHLSDLSRTRSGPFSIQDCIDGNLVFNPDLPPFPLLSYEQIHPYVHCP